MRDRGNLRTRGPHCLDSIVVGYYRGKELVYLARVKNGFVPASRRQMFEKLRLLVIPECPFVNLPEKHRSRWTTNPSQYRNVNVGRRSARHDLAKGIEVRKIEESFPLCSKRD
jgi:ATP-dependent DNA ligase